MPLAYIPSPARSVWHLGPVPFRAQALFAVAGILLALFVASRRYRAAGGGRGVIADVAAWAVPAGLIPAVAGVILARHHPGPWQAVRDWDTTAGLPGAVAFGVCAAALACRHARGPGGTRVRLAPVLGAAAPAIPFGQAVAEIGAWFAQQDAGHPSSLWWAVQISPTHRPQGLENFATFQPLFLYQALWDVAAGAAIIWASGRFALRGDRALALAAAVYGLGGFALFWLGIGHLPVVLGLRAGLLGDAAVLVIAGIYLGRTRHMRTATTQFAQKSALERDSPVV